MFARRNIICVEMRSSTGSRTKAESRQQGTGKTENGIKEKRAVMARFFTVGMRVYL